MKEVQESLDYHPTDRPKIRCCCCCCCCSEALRASIRARRGTATHDTRDMSETISDHYRFCCFPPVCQPPSVALLSTVTLPHQLALYAVRPFVVARRSLFRRAGRRARSSVRKIPLPPSSSSSLSDSARRANSISAAHAMPPPRAA